MTTTEQVRLDPRNRVVLTILLISTFVVFLNETILGVALPQIMKQLNIQPSTGQWLSTAYMLTMAIVIPVALHRIIVRLGIHREIEPFLNVPTSLLACLGLTVVGYRSWDESHNPAYQLFL